LFQNGFLKPVNIGAINNHSDSAISFVAFGATEEASGRWLPTRQKSAFKNFRGNRHGASGTGMKLPILGRECAEIDSDWFRSSPTRQASLAGSPHLR
jgi:hypothetical protein